MNKVICSLLFGTLLVSTSHTALVPLNQATYIIVVNSVLRDATWENQLIALKEAQGLKVGLLSVTDANFSNLSTAYSQRRIRDSLKTAYTAGGKILKYVLLVGDANGMAATVMSQNQAGVGEDKNYASSRYLNFIPGPSREGRNSDHFSLSGYFGAPVATTDYKNAFIPSVLSNENGMISSDDFYGNYEGDMTLPFDYDVNKTPDNQPHIVPEAMVGRIPVRNKTEMKNFVSKLASYNTNLTTSTTAISTLQKNILGLIDDAPNSYTPPDRARRPFEQEYPLQIPSGITLAKAYYNQVPDLFNKNGKAHLLTLYGSAVGLIGELSPFMRYRNKYEPNPAYLNHNRSGTASTSDDDIDDYPAVSSGQFTILAANICDKLDFDGADYADRQKILKLISGSSTYSDGYFASNSDLIEDVLLNATKGPVAVIGVRYNSTLEENTEFNKRLLNAVYGGGSIIGDDFRSAKLYSNAKFPFNKSRNNRVTQFGDEMLFGDPAMIINTPNNSAAFGNPSSITVSSDKGNIVASWPAVSGASGYSVSIGNFKGIPYWTYLTATASYRFKETFPGGTLLHGETYYVTVKPYFQGSSVPRTFPRGAGITGSAVLDAKVSPPASASAVGQPNKTAVITITKSQDTDIKGHLIYQELSGGFNKKLLTASPITGTSYTDASASLWKDYQYAVTAVDNKNNESIPVETGVIHVGPQAGSGFTISYKGQRTSVIDGSGNMYLVKDVQSGLLSGLVFKRLSTNTGVSLKTDGWLIGSSVATFGGSYLGTPSNLTGGLTLRKGTAAPIFHAGSNAKVTLAQDFFRNTF